MEQSEIDDLRREFRTSGDPALEEIAGTLTDRALARMSEMMMDPATRTLIERQRAAHARMEQAIDDPDYDLALSEDSLERGPDLPIREV